MKCPNCGKEMTGDFCSYCGYMSNGKFIKMPKISYQKQKCPNCGKEMTRDFCSYCGYMLNGNFIQNKEPKISNTEKALSDDYYIVLRNKNYITVFLLGPTYFCYRNYFFLGIFFGIANILFHALALKLITTQNLLFPGLLEPFLVPVYIILYFIFNRLFWVTIANWFYLYLIDCKVKKIEKKYKKRKDFYIEKIKYRNIWKGIIGVICYIFMIIVACLIAYYF